MNAGERINCRVKIRYRHQGQTAAVEMIGKDEVRISFEEPVRAATPGQSAVLYDDDNCIIGGGVITEVLG